MNKKNLFFLFLVLLWMVLIFCLSNMSSIESNKRSKEIVNQIVDNSSSINNNVNYNIEKSNNYNLIFRKGAHIFMYMVLCILVLTLIFIIYKNISYKYYIIAFIICFIYACFDEIHQLYVNGRTGQFLDVLIDSIGIIIGFIVFLLFRKIKRSIKC